jgi:RNA polymerase sigma-70 factor (ECF subfamily)
MILIFIFLSDKEFILLKSRNTQVFEKVYRNMKDIVFNFLIIKTNGDYTSTEEIFSDTFHSALISAPGLKSSKNIQSWLLQIASRRFIDYIRKKYREKKYKDMMQRSHSNPGDIHEELHKKEKILLMNMALKNIKTDYSTVLREKYIEDKSIKEIASTLGKSDKAIESLLTRAKKALKTEMEHISRDFFR